MEEQMFTPRILKNEDDGYEYVTATLDTFDLFQLCRKLKEFKELTFSCTKFKNGFKTYAPNDVTIELRNDISSSWKSGGINQYDCVKTAHENLCPVDAMNRRINFILFSLQKWNGDQDFLLSNFYPMIAQLISTEFEVQIKK